MELSNLINNGEGESAEFKASLSQIDAILKTISAFSNKIGGTILIGVTDDKKISGVDIGRNTLENLANGVRKETDPQIFPYIDYQEIDNKTVICIRVSESSTKPVFYRDKAYIRVGRSNQKLSASEIRSLITNENNIVSWDEQILNEAILDDIDGKKLALFLQIASSKRNLDIDPAVSIEEALKRLELTKNGNLTNAAIILFGKNPQKFFLQAITKCAKFKGINTNEFEDMHDFEGTIIDQRDDALRFAEKHIIRSAKISGSDRLEEFEYPLEALREAISNAICHRDYRINSNVQLRIFVDRIEIWGSGTLPEPLTVDDLKTEHDSIRRNPLIARCFFRMGIVEEWGTGTQRIIDSCLENGLPEPIFEIKSGNLVVTIRKYQFTQFDKAKLNERQKKAIDYLIEQDKITNEQYRKLNNVQRNTASKDLKSLVEEGILLSKGKGRYTFYILK